ncbi:hypothetical protein [Neorhizobium tomejilense]|uniref:hypothetical protein n=1 Tax=Neorhizobium tomejilense TaxID=2093828 RepID=UPI000CF8474C|nr:hypothetical protein [Neorhizobium tomejilense]
MKIIIAAVLLSGIAPFAIAQDAKGAFQTFFDRCLVEGPQFDKVVDKAKQEEWPLLATDMAMAFTPAEAPIAIQGWMIGDQSAEAFEALVVFKADVSGKQVEGCTVALSGTDAAAFERGLALRARARALGEETGQDTIYKRYETNVAGRDVAVTLTVPRYPKGSDQVLASAVAQALIEN